MENRRQNRQERHATGEKQWQYWRAHAGYFERMAGEIKQMATPINLSAAVPSYLDVVIFAVSNACSAAVAKVGAAMERYARSVPRGFECDAWRDFMDEVKVRQRVLELSGEPVSLQVDDD